MKDATLTASKIHVNPPFRQTVRVERFPTSKMDAARAAYYNRSPALTSDEKYRGVAAAQRRKYRAAGTLTPSARAAQARIAAGHAAKSHAKLPSRATDRIESKDVRPRTERPRTDALRLDNARTERAGTSSRPALYTGPGAAPDFRRLRRAENAAAAPAAPRSIKAPTFKSSLATSARAEASEVAPQPSESSFASSFQTARSFLSRLSSSRSLASHEARPNRFAAMVPKRGLLGWLSRWLGWS